MKKIFFFPIVLALLVACAESTQITGSWKSPQQPAIAHNSIFVAALTANNVARSTVENDLANELEKQGVSVYKSMDEFPPGLKNDSLTKQDILNRMKNKKNDAILTVSVLRKETESRYIPDGGYPYAPFPRYPYYGDFWGYYSYWYPYMYSPGYYAEDRIYYMEANLYDAETSKLLWSAQSRTYNPGSLQDFSKEFSRIIVARLKADGMLKPAGALSKQ